MEKITRRRFLESGVAASLLTIVPRHVLGRGQIPPSEKMNIAGIGIGGMGAANLRELETENIVALCDVDPNYAADTIKRYPEAKVYTDYREMLDKQKDIDGVVIATPDHTHAVISMAAMQAGKHVYCQKPLTHDVYEARMLAQGGQGGQGRHADGHPGAFGRGHPPDLRMDLGRPDRRGPRGRRLVQPVLLSLGPRRLEFAVGRTPGRHAAAAGRAGLGPLDRPGADAAVPSRPIIPPVWRCWWDFGCGMMGDRGAHTLDPVGLRR